MFTTQLIQTKRWLEANSITTFWLKTFIGATLLAIFAQISVPMYPVPITGQTLALTVVGFAMGRKAATAAVLLYLLKGRLVYLSLPAVLQVSIISLVQQADTY